MWNSCAKLPRLDNALRLRGLDPNKLNVADLAKVLRRRGITDRQLNPIIWQLVEILEPPGCPMAHCKYYGHSRAPMNCDDGRIPGRCDILRAYKKRQARRTDTPGRDEAAGRP